MNPVEPAASEVVGQILRTITDGNEAERLAILHTVAGLAEDTRRELAAVVRREMTSRFSPDRGIPARERGRVGSIRAWLVSCLVETEDNTPETRTLLLDRCAPGSEPDRDVRYWTLANLHHRLPDLAREAAAHCVDDEAPEVALLASAVLNPDAAAQQLSEAILSKSDDVALAGFRAFRAVPLEVCTDQILSRLTSGLSEELQHAALRALAESAWSIVRFTQALKPERAVGLVLDVGSKSDDNSLRAFARLLSGLDPE